MAAIDIVIDICKREVESAIESQEEARQKGYADDYFFFQGKKVALNDLILKFEGFKKLFN